MSDLRIKPLPPETLAAQRPVVEAPRQAVTPAVSTPGGSANGSATGNGGGETPREQYISPFISIDPTSGLVITQYRDSESGELQQQYPSEKVVREYRNLQPAAVSPSGGRGVAPPAGPSAEPAGQAEAVIIGRAASGPVQGVPAPAPAPVPGARPAPAPVAAVPTGGVDKGSA